jgi:hypothetical protein
LEGKEVASQLVIIIFISLGRRWAIWASSREGVVSKSAASLREGMISRFAAWASPREGLAQSLLHGHFLGSSQEGGGLKVCGVGSPQGGGGLKVCRMGIF